jgi:hypothetical protein
MTRNRPIPVLLALLGLLASCGRGEVASSATTDIPRPPLRVVAIGDLHGHLDLAQRALRLAGAIDAGGSWIGGKLVVVQTGDQIDRGDEDRAVIDLFDALAAGAAAAGGRVISLLGNHETKNVEGRYEYVEPTSMGAFAGFYDHGKGDADALRFPPELRGRRAAFRPGGPYAMRLSQRPVLAQVDGTLFVHGGIAPRYVEQGIVPLNELARRWMRGPIAGMPALLQERDSPLWDRTYSANVAAEDCARLDRMLPAFRAGRLVIGHSVQPSGINPACGGKVWRVDTGMWLRSPGPLEVLEITGGATRVLKGD